MNINDLLEISHYNPNWPIYYEEEKKMILRVLSRWIEAIEHIGSTSIKGLAGKPVIDILIGVRSLEEADKHCVQGLKSIGYQYIKEHEEKMPDRRFFVKYKDKKRFAHIHLVEKDSDLWKRHIVFRDYLRNNPSIAKEYEELKRRLVQSCQSKEEYTTAKSPFIKTIEKKLYSSKI